MEAGFGEEGGVSGTHAPIDVRTFANSSADAAVAAVANRRRCARIRPAVGWRADNNKRPLGGEKRTREKGHVTVVPARYCRCFRPCRAAALRAGAGRRLSDPSHHHHCVAGRRHGDGYRGAPLWRETCAAPRPASCDRKSAGRRRCHRRRDHRQGHAGWLYARSRDQRCHGDPTDAVQAAAVRSDHGLRADLALREIAVRFHRQPVAAGPLRPRVHQIRQGAPGPNQLQLLRHRRSAPFDGGVAETEVRVRHGPRAVSKQSAIDR